MKNIVVFLIVTLSVMIPHAQSHARYHPGWKWRTICNDHFTIYYPEGHELFARRVLSLTGEVYDDVAGYLDVKPRRCPIVLNPGTDIFNGFYNVFPNRISLFETPVFTLRGLGPGSDFMDEVFTHEYTHFAHVTTRQGWYGALCRIIGDGLAVTNGISPGWIIEGVATNAETMFTDGGRGRCSLFKGEMMSFTEGKGLWSMSAAGTRPPYSPPRKRIYLSGYHMVEYMNRVYGGDAFAMLSKYQARHPIGSTRKALKHVTGKSHREFYREFVEDYTAQTGKLQKRISAVGLPAGREIFSEPLDTVTAHFWTENGTIQILRTGYDMKTTLVEISPVTGEILHKTTTGRLNNLDTVNRIPDGRLVFGEHFLHPLGKGDLDFTNLVIFDQKTKMHTRLTRGEHVYSADLSPDGTTFVAARRNGMWTDLILLNEKELSFQTLVSEPGLLWETPRWSPDGSCIAAVVKSGKNSDIVLINPDTGKMKPLYRSDIHEDNDPFFSPNCRWIVLSSNRGGVWNIFAWDTIETRLYQLTSVYYAACDPKISPDGKTLSFKSMHRGMYRLCTMPFEPRAGKEIAVETGGVINEPDLHRLQPETAFESKGIPLWEAYKPFVHTPYCITDVDGGKLGLFFMGADPVGINMYYTEILYGMKSGRLGYDVGIYNTSFWPMLKARVYDRTEEDNKLGGGANYLYRERGGEFSLGLDVIHRIAPSALQSYFQIGTRFRRFDDIDDLKLGRNRNQSFSVFGEISLLRIPDSASRSMVPAGGQMLKLSHEVGIPRFKGEIPGHNTVLSVKQYVPSF
ncbi:TolB family protein, partial [Candidatus Latescibacterota bacterium]